MQLVPVEALHPGMRLARSISRADGKLLLAGGVTLRDEYIVALRRVGIGSVYVSDGYFEDVEVPEPVRAEVKAEAARCVAAAMDAVPLRRGVDVRGVARTVDNILRDILSNRDAIMALVDARSTEDAFMQHAATTAVLTLYVGQQLGLGRPQLFELGVGALLHDVGEVMVPRHILQKAGGLTAEESEAMQSHCLHGFNILRQSPEIHLLSAHVAYQHHERLDGSGYPRRLRGQEIHLYAAITAVADVYDALTARRPYRQPVHPSAALVWIREHAGRLFHSHAVSAFCRVVAPYPVATMVELSTGEVALVRELVPESMDRPRVIILRDAHGAPLKDRVELDLRAHPDVYIRRHVEGTGYVKP